MSYARDHKLVSTKVPDGLERVDARYLSVEEFINRYEKSYTPVVITHLTDEWPAKKKWTIKVCVLDYLYEVCQFAVLIVQRFVGSLKREFWRVFDIEAGDEIQESEVQVRGGR
jgi:hypothetical protein